MGSQGRGPQTAGGRIWRRVLAAVVGVGLLAAACGGDDDDSSSSTTQDPVAAAEARVQTAQTNLNTAKGELSTAQDDFCAQTKTYAAALDRYGKLFTDTTATVGDVKTFGKDLTAPRESVTSAATAITDAQTKLTNAEKELADAQTGLANAKATASSQSTATTTPPTSTSSTTLVPTATIDRVKQAENDFAAMAQGITDATPLVEATVEYHSAAFALEIAWLSLLADAGCLTDEQHQKAVEQVIAYTLALQSQLQAAGYYTGDVDGIYGPMTVDAVQKLQTEAGLPTTGVVDQATALALDKKLAAKAGQAAAAQPQSQTAAVQTVLKLTGYWSGPIDGLWTDGLTDALMSFQSALGVEPTGVVDAATLAAWQQALAEAKTAAATTTTSSAAATTTSAATSSTTTTAPTTTTTAATTTTGATTTSS